MDLEASMDMDMDNGTRMGALLVSILKDSHALMDDFFESFCDMHTNPNVQLAANESNCL
jgi:hypothetical protein